MPRVTNRKNITIIQDQTGGSQPEFKRTINIEFVPDELIVRCIAYQNDSSEVNVGYIYSDLVRDNILGSVIDGKTFNNSNQVFTIGEPVHGIYTFSCRQADGSFDDAMAGVPMISLEFVKYAHGH